MGVSSGLLTVTVIGADGRIKDSQKVHNLVTDAGDEYYARKMAAAISPANPSAPTAMNGMKLGTGSGAAAKSSTGAALVTYASGSNKAFDTSYPTVTEVGTDVGWQVNYVTTWTTGTFTSVIEVALVNDAGTDANSSAANTYARAVITSVSKGTDDTLEITWSHKYLGS